MKLNIAHIINPVKVDRVSDLFTAQPITFETMKIAQETAKNEVNVSLYSAQYHEDESIIPDYFTKTPNLERSVLDLGCFKKARKLPLIKDILDRLYQANPEADYLIYTNADIALQPHFYIEVTKLIDQGYDAFVINRRVIDKKYTKIEEIPLMYPEKGKSHIGHDCFIFKRSLYPKFELGQICIGMPLIGRALYVNCVLNSTNFEEFKNLYLTFHIGNNWTWGKKIFNDYHLYNKNQMKNIMSYFLKNQKLKEEPLIKKTFPALGMSPPFEKVN